MQTCNPLHARQWFKARPYVNILATIVAFAIVLFILTYFLDFWLAILVSGVVSTGFFFFYLELQTITIICTSCRRPVDTNIPWLCGYHKCINKNVRHFPFINECEECNQIPKAYQCHHSGCGRLIHLTNDTQDKFFARRLTAEELVPPVPEDKIGKKVATQSEKIRDLHFKFKVARLESNIELEKKRKITPEDVSLFDATLNELENLYNQKMTKEDAAEALREKIRQKYAGNENEIARRIAVIDRIMSDEI